MTASDNNIFSKEARKALVDLGMTITQLAIKLKRPRETVSRAIHGHDFPLVRKAIAKRLSIQHLIDA